MSRNNRRSKTSIRHQRLPGTTCADKKRYKTEQEALAAKEHQELLTLGLQLKVYACSIPGCSGWHLTRSND